MEAYYSRNNSYQTGQLPLQALEQFQVEVVDLFPDQAFCFF
jgi:hypothetical protein